MGEPKEKERSSIIVGIVLVAIVTLAFLVFYRPSGSAASSDKDVNGCYTPESVRNHYGEETCVDYTVGYVHETSAGTKFLDEKEDYSRGFVGYIPYNSGAKNTDINSLNGKKIRVDGKIQEYNGYPEIIINDSNQVKYYTN